MLPYTPPKAILIPPLVMKQMQEEVERLPDEEDCGLLAGQFDGEQYRVEMMIPMTNTLHSPVRYLMDPNEQLAAFTQIEAQEMELVGIFHSHISLPTGPSATDIREAYYPEAVYLIWSRAASNFECRAFSIQEGIAAKVEIIIS